MTTKLTLGKRIAQARRELGVREHRDVLQSDVAGAVGVGAATVSRWEADQAVPRDAVLEQLALYLGTTPAFLRYGILDAQTSTPREVDVPQPNPALDQRISDEEIRAARAQVAARKRPAAKKANGRHHGRG